LRIRRPSFALGAEGKTTVANLVFKAVSLPVERAARLLLVMIAAPALGESGFGVFQFAATVSSLVALGSDIGLSVWTTRALARDRTRAAAIVGTGLRLRAAATLPCLLVLGAAASLTRSADARHAMALLGLSALANSFVDYFGAVFRGYERLGDEAAVNMTRAALTLGIGWAALAYARSVTGLALGLLLGTLVSLGHAAWTFRHRYGLRAIAGTVFDRTLARAAIGQGIPLWLSTLVSLLYFKADVIMMRAIRGDAELGAYSAAYKIFEALLLFPAVGMAAAFPPLARAGVDPARRRRLEALVLAVLLGVGLVAAAVIFAFTRPLVVAVYGDGYLAAVPSLRVLSIALPILFFNSALRQFLIARDLERHFLVVSLVMLLVNVALNTVLIPRFGGPGAAWSTLLTEVVLTVACFVSFGARPRRPVAPAEDRGT
jgi:O-antigen/teichoic acid export membrane protein